MKKLSELYHISSRGNIRNEASKGFVRPTLKQTLAPYKKGFEEIISTLIEYTIDQCEGGIATADSYTSDPNLAFDNDGVTGPYPVTSDLEWRSDNPQSFPHWLKYDFGVGNEKRIEKYTLRAGTYDINNKCAPKDWIFQGSNDDFNWVDLDTRSGYTYDWGETKEFTFSNENYYRYYRIYVTKSLYSETHSNTTDVVIHEMEMMERIYG